jgi:undecaprenyl-diphosphatase
MSHATHVASLPFVRRIKHVWHRRSHQIGPAIAVSLVLLGAFAFWELSVQVDRGRTLHFDEMLLRAMRRPDNPGVPIGPYWLHEAGLDATALGSPLVLAFFVFASIGLLYFEGQKRVAAMTAWTAGSGVVLSLFLKFLFERPRPEVVPHLRLVTSTSFPSGHSMGAAVVYLTLGVMFMKSFRSRRAKAFCMFWAVLITLVVGASRVYLGVHYPSDVLGGWIAGCGWATACWAIGQFIPNRPLPEVSDEPRAKQAA